MRHFQHILFAAIAAFLLAFAMSVQGQWFKLPKGIVKPPKTHVPIIPEIRIPFAKPPITHVPKIPKIRIPFAKPPITHVPKIPEIRIPSSNNARSHTTPHYSTASHVTPEASILSPPKDLDKITSRRTEPPKQADQQELKLQQEREEQAKPESLSKLTEQQVPDHGQAPREEMQKPPKEKASIKRIVTVEEMRLRPYSRLIKICGESAIKIWGDKENNRSLGDNVKQPTNDKDRYHNEALPVFDFAA